MSGLFSMDAWATVWNHRESFLLGLGNTLMTAFFALALAFAIGAAIGIITILRNKDYAYGLVILWAYAGIVIKHVSETGFNSMYPAVMITTIAAMVLVVVAEVMAITKKAY